MGLGLSNAYGAVAGRKALKDIIAEREMASIEEQQRMLKADTIRAQSSRADEQLGLQKRAQTRLEEASKAAEERRWQEQMHAQNVAEAQQISMDNALQGVSDPQRANVLRSVYRAGGKVGADDIMPPKAKRENVSFYVNGREVHGSYDPEGKYYDASGKQVLNPQGKPPEPKASSGGEPTPKDLYALNQANAQRAKVSNETLSVLSELIDPQAGRLKPGVSGAIGPLDQFIPDNMVGLVNGATAQQKRNIINQLTAKQFMAGVQQMRGMGALSDAEGRKIADSVTAMRTNLGDNQFYSEVSKIYNAMVKMNRIVIMPDGREREFSTMAAAEEMRAAIAQGVR